MEGNIYGSNSLYTGYRYVCDKGRRRVMKVIYVQVQIMIVLPNKLQRIHITFIILRLDYKDYSKILCNLTVFL